MEGVLQRYKNFGVIKTLTFKNGVEVWNWKAKNK